MFDSFSTSKGSEIKATYITWLWVAELCFFAGGMIDVILSYIYLTSENIEQSLAAIKSAPADRTEVVSAVLWVVSSFLTTFVKHIIGKEGIKPTTTATDLSKGATIA
jgi:hypothetical protein